jgi:hypothetical protein
MHPHNIIRLSFGIAALLFIAFVAFRQRRNVRDRARGPLVIAQIALALPLLIFVGLLARSVIQMRLLNPGISGDTSRRAVLALRTDRYGTPQQRKEFFDRVVVQLSHVPGLRMSDSGSALPLAGNNYYALFFSIGSSPPASHPPGGQRFILWQADIEPELLAVEVNRVVKTLDRGIHYWSVGQVNRMDQMMLIAFGVYGVLALLLIYVGSRGAAPGSAAATAVVGIAIGVGLSWAAARYLTGLLFGVSVTDAATFSASSIIVMGVVLSACLVKRRMVRHDSSAYS